MKIKLILYVFSLLTLCLGFTSCRSKVLPKVKNSFYETYNRGDEKGYNVEFELSHDSIKPNAVVINKIKERVFDYNRNGKKYEVTVIAQSRKLEGFKPQIIESPDGIFFKTDTADVFKQVDFKLKNK